MTFKPEELISITAVTATPLPLAYSGGTAYWSVAGDFDGNTAKLVVSQDGVTFNDADTVQLTADGGDALEADSRLVIALDVNGGGANPDLKISFGPIKQSKTVT